MNCPICSNNDENEFTCESTAFPPDVDYEEWWCARCCAVWVADAEGRLIEILFEH
jgi:hypothetical protein